MPKGETVGNVVIDGKGDSIEVEREKEAARCREGRATTKEARQ